MYTALFQGIGKLKNSQIAVENMDFSTISTGFSTRVKKWYGEGEVCKTVDITIVDKFQLFPTFFPWGKFTISSLLSEKKNLTALVGEILQYCAKNF